VHLSRCRAFRNDFDDGSRTRESDAHGVLMLCICLVPTQSHTPNVVYVENGFVIPVATLPLPPHRASVDKHIYD
jgi:hypothetical protein